MAGPSWSDAGSWAGGVAPSGAVGTLTFPEVGPCPCFSTQAADDIAGLSVSGLSIDDSVGYDLVGSGEPLALGAGGITATPSSGNGSRAALPSLTLTAPQTWTVIGDNGSAGLAVGNTSGGGGDTLAINLSDGAYLPVFGDIETGALSLNGSGKLTQYYPLLNATSGGPVSISGGTTLLMPSGETGPLTVSDGTVAINGFAEDGAAVSARTLSIRGAATLGSEATLSLEFGSEFFETVGTEDDQAQLRATGPINLGGATLNFTGTTPCASLTPGEVFTLVTTVGSLTGTFANAPNGSIVPFAGSSCGQTAKITYTSSSVIATVVDAGPQPVVFSTSASTEHSVTNQPVTLRTILTPHYGPWPAGTVEFANANNGTTISGCGAVRVTESGADGIAVCRASFSPADSPLTPELTFTPADPSTDARSTNSSPIGGYYGPELMVSRDPTRTVLSAARRRVSVGRRVTVTATVFPTFTGRFAPTGTVSFFNGGKPVKACAKERLNKTTLTALCRLPKQLSGEHPITARYSGDGNFIASTSRKLTITVQHLGANGHQR